jgi:CRP-like cAMP-binding protein
VGGQRGARGARQLEALGADRPQCRLGRPISDLFYELLVRYRAVGLAEGHTIELPATQAEIGDALGLSTVHINRVLQELRSGGLIAWAGGSLTGLDWQGLKQAGEFDPTYLHLQNRQAA